jgi:hypothetical protein
VAEVRHGGQRIAATSSLTSDWLKTWGTFNLTIDTGPFGPVEIFVGHYSLRNAQEGGSLHSLDDAVRRVFGRLAMQYHSGRN